MYVCMYVCMYVPIVVWEVKGYNSALRGRRLQLGRFVFSLVFELRIAVEIKFSESKLVY